MKSRNILENSLRRLKYIIYNVRRARDVHSHHSFQCHTGSVSKHSKVRNGNKRYTGWEGRNKPVSINR